MPRSTASFLVALLLPWAVLAQDLPPVTEPASAEDSVAAPPLMQAPEDAPAEASPATPVATGSSEPEAFLTPRKKRILVGTVAGSLGTVAGGALGGTLSLQRLASCGSFPGTIYCGESLVPLYVGMAAGSGLGVYTSSRLMGGKGNLLLTMLGAGLGTVPVALLSDGNPPGRPAVSKNGTHIIASMLLPTAGALLFNEISHAVLGPEPVPVQHRKDPGFLVAPTVGATPRGDAMGGLVGRF
ncbi:hypothetical protein [Pyxidicoccus trucidator]|uniref:hypothetical protein n=1 Tax=Pyxidicoccus trucidator TaxID=2709662 RepID=UPI0013DD34B1|nr:hypothetical protein [Pyxidicoccus trucidator]